VSLGGDEFRAGSGARGSTGFPAVVRLLADAVLPADVRLLAARPTLTQHSNDLLFIESALPHTFLVAQPGIEPGTRGFSEDPDTSE